MSITKEDKQKIISDFAINKNDTGSAEVQIAIISKRINNLSEHFKNHNHDNHSKRGLLALVNKRKKLLSYLLKNNKPKYQEIIKTLNIRGWRNIINIKYIRKK